MQPPSWVNYFKFMQFFTRDRIYTPSFGLKIKIFLRFTPSPNPPTLHAKYLKFTAPSSKVCVQAWLRCIDDDFFYNKFTVEPGHKESCSTPCKTETIISLCIQDMNYHHLFVGPTDCLSKQKIPYLFPYKAVFPFQNNNKSLDLFCKTDLDFGIHFERLNPII